KLTWFRLSLPSVPSPGAPRHPRGPGFDSRRRALAARRAGAGRGRCLSEGHSGGANPAAFRSVAIPAVIEAKRSAARASARPWVAAESHLRELFSFVSKTLRSAWNWSKKVCPHGVAQSAIPYTPRTTPGEAPAPGEGWVR